MYPASNLVLRGINPIKNRTYNFLMYQLEASGDLMGRPVRITNQVYSNTIPGNLAMVV